MMKLGIFRAASALPSGHETWGGEDLWWVKSVEKREMML
jgi:hypothetical protein